MRKLILHLGVHRTGTTSIQKYLAENRAALAHQGFTYPGDAENHADLAWALLRRTNAAEEFARRVGEAVGPKVIISAEDLSRVVRRRTLQKITSGFEVHAVIFARRQDEWLESWYNQNVRWPFSDVHSRMSPLEFLGTLPEYHWIQYDVLYKRWAPFCSRVDVIVYDEVADSIDAFCSACGIEQTAFVRPATDSNGSSISANGLEIVRLLGLTKLSQRTRGMVLRAVRSLENGQPAASVFPLSIKNMILQQFGDSNARLARILGRADQVLFPPASEDLFAPATLPDSETLLRDFVAPLLLAIDRSLRQG